MSRKQNTACYVNVNSYQLTDSFILTPLNNAIKKHINEGYKTF